MVKKAYQETFVDTVTVSEKTKVKRANGSTGFETVDVLTDEPCRLSFSNISSANQGDGVASVSTVVKLFVSPDIEIKPGSRLTVTHQGRTNEYGLSGNPAVYLTHQEFVLNDFGGFT